MPCYKADTSTEKSAPIEQGTVIFIDLDGTTVKFPFKRRILPYAIRELSEKANIDPQKVKKMLMNREYAREIELSNRRYDWDDIVKEVAKELGIEWKQDLGKLSEESKISNDFVYPRTKQTLKGLRSRRYILCAATNGFYSTSIRYSKNLA
ncbi:MAG: HAD family hydrolase [Nitrososphaeria archaeon]